MSDRALYVWTAIAGLVLVVFLTRNAFQILPRRFQPSGALDRALRFAPLAALTALTVPDALGGLLAAGADGFSVLQDGRLPAAVVTLAVARWTRAPVPGLAAGTAVLLLTGMLG